MHAGKLYITALVGLAMATSLSAMPHKMDDHHSNRHFFNEKTQKELSLENAQHELIKTINEKYKQSYIQHKAQLKPIYDQITQIEKNETQDPNYSELEALFAQANVVHTQVKIDKIKHHREILSVLNPIQKEKLNKMRSEKHEKMKKEYQKKMKDKDKEKSKRSR
jgi:Spy/CpxP family protein refolding chaperone